MGRLPEQPPEDERAGPSLPVPTPPSHVFGATPAHTANLVATAQAYVDGYNFGYAHGSQACSSHTGAWHHGCLGGGDEREKFIDRPCRDLLTDSDELSRSLDRKGCQIGRETLGSTRETTQDWLASYDKAYTEKVREWDCGNGSAPSNDGCRAGAGAWHHSEAQH